MQVRTTRSAQVRRTTERRRTMTIDAGRSPMVVEQCLLDQHGDRSAALASRRRRCAAGPEVPAQASRSSGRERLVLRSGIRKTRTSSWQHPFDENERLRIDLDAIGERYPRMNAQVDTGVVRGPRRQDDRPRGRASRRIHHNAMGTGRAGGEPGSTLQHPWREDQVGSEELRCGNASGGGTGACAAKAVTVAGCWAKGATGAVASLGGADIATGSRLLHMEPSARCNTSRSTLPPVGRSRRTRQRGGVLWRPSPSVSVRSARP